MTAYTGKTCSCIRRYLFLFTSPTLSHASHYLFNLQGSSSLGNNVIFFLSFSTFTRFGSLFNVARLIADDFRLGFEKGPWWQRIFDGYSITTWLVVLNLGSTGLLVSWLMKYADNIVKVKYQNLYRA